MMSLRKRVSGHWSPHKEKGTALKEEKWEVWRKQVTSKTK